MKLARRKPLPAAILPPVAGRPDQRRSTLVPVLGLAAHVAHRLVQQDRHLPRLMPARGPVHRHRILHRHPLPHVARLAVHQHPAALDPVIGLAARAQPQIGHALVEPDASLRMSSHRTGRALGRRTGRLRSPAPARCGMLPLGHRHGRCQRCPAPGRLRVLPLCRETPLWRTVIPAASGGLRAGSRASARCALAFAWASRALLPGPSRTPERPAPLPLGASPAASLLPSRLGRTSSAGSTGSVVRRIAALAAPHIAARCGRGFAPVSVGTAGRGLAAGRRRCLGGRLRRGGTPEHQAGTGGSAIIGHGVIMAVPPSCRLQPSSGKW